MSEGMLVATRKGLFILERGNGGWAIAARAFEGTPVTAAMYDARAGALYAALKHGHFGPKLHCSTDYGRSWQEVATPAFPVETPDAPALDQIWTVEGGSEPGQLWIGGIPAGLFRSSDGGESWQFVSQLWSVPERGRWFGGGYDHAGIHTVSPDPRDPARIFVAISCGGVWESRDDGANWSLLGQGLIAAYMPPDQAHTLEVQDPHRVVRCQADPDVMWMQHHNGVFRSTDAGATWERLTPAIAEFGFAVAVHPEQPGTAWLAPAIADEKRIPRDGALAVTRTSDGGETWHVHRQGLPQRDAYDLIYRHALDVDGSGQRLAMGSTTGALWVSDNGGEAWQLVNAHLPPIYAVRFASSA